MRHPQRIIAAHCEVNIFEFFYLSFRNLPSSCYSSLSCHCSLALFALAPHNPHLPLLCAAASPSPPPLNTSVYLSVRVSVSTPVEVDQRASCSFSSLCPPSSPRPVFSPASSSMPHSLVRSLAPPSPPPPTLLSLLRGALFSLHLSSTLLGSARVGSIRDVSVQRTAAFSSSRDVTRHIVEGKRPRFVLLSVYLSARLSGLVAACLPACRSVCLSVSLSVGLFL